MQCIRQTVASWKMSLIDYGLFLLHKLTTLTTVSQCVLSEKKQQQKKNKTPFLCSLISELHPVHHTLGFRGCRPKWPLLFYEIHLPPLPHILLRVINYAGKQLALRGKTAAPIWRQPQFLPDLFRTCSPTTAFWIHCNAYKVSILRLLSFENKVHMSKIEGRFFSVGLLA